MPSGITQDMWAKEVARVDEFNDAILAFLRSLPDD